MRVSTRVEVNLRTREIANQVEGFAQAFAHELAVKAAEYAAENVAPGVGPGPHPHRPGWPHVDTGALAASVQVVDNPRGFLKTAIVFTDLEYGAHLEFGWTNPVSGRHWRYPWLSTALDRAAQDAAEVARSTSRRWLSEEGRMYRGRVNLTAPQSATWLPEEGG
jgi:hypothetical protein